MNPYTAKSSLYFLLAFMLLATPGAMLLLSSCSFLLGGTIRPWHFPLSILLVYLLQYYVVRIYFPSNKFKVFIQLGLIHMGILAFSMILSGLIYDLSYDGQAYHMETIYHLKNGWNPVYQTLSGNIYQSVWINHYAKGAEIPQAVIYSFTGKIETGKCTNIILLAASFFLCLSFLSRIRGISSFKIVLIGLLAVLNPVMINQVNTFYIDGQMACLLLCLLLAGCLIVAEYTWPHILLFCMILLVLVNIKFTAIPFAGIGVLGLLILLTIHKRKYELLKVASSVAIVGILAITVAGFNPYIKNILTKGHPFYPIMSANQNPVIDIIKENSPAGFPEKNRFEKFYLSFFSHSINIHERQKVQPQLKIPFTFNKNDITYTSGVDTRIAGFGLFFSGIMLVSLILLAFLILRIGLNESLKSCIFVLVILLISVFIIPEPWWARYVPQLWVVPIVVLVFVEASALNRSSEILKGFLYLVICCNIIISLLSLPRTIVQNIYLNYQLEQLRSYPSPVQVNWGYSASNRIRMQERGIIYKEAELDTGHIQTLISSGNKNSAYCQVADQFLNQLLFVG